jgi:hypothetical protein
VKPIPVLFVLLLSCVVFAALPAQTIDTTVCDILANPQSFDGKIVRIKGTVIAGFEEFTITNPDCGQGVGGIWLSYPSGTKGKAGPLVFLGLQLSKNNPVQSETVTRQTVLLEKNKDFKNFDSLLSMPAKTDGVCLGCVKFSVNATLVGRLDGAAATGYQRDAAGQLAGVSGFGHMNGYRARLVLQSVNEIAPHEINYDKSTVPTIKEINAMISAYSPPVQEGEQVKKATDALGAPGEHNGVLVGFGVANEVSKNDSGKSHEDSPDGMVFGIELDADRAKGQVVDLAMSHVGTHIADIRSSKIGPGSSSMYQAEFHAYQTSVLNALGFRLKLLMLPGGHVIWSSDWPDSDRSKYAYSEIFLFLTKWAHISMATK